MIEYLLYLCSFLALSGTIGIIRMPDLYTRVHASTVSTVGGALFALLLLAAKIPEARVKILLLAAIIIIAAPTESYLIGNAAYRSGVKPYK